MAPRAIPLGKPPSGLTTQEWLRIFRRVSDGVYPHSDSAPHGPSTEVKTVSTKARRFLLIYCPIVAALACLTVTTLNPFVFPTPQVGLTGILPMLGFTVLLGGVVLGALILHMMDERHLVKPFIGIGLVVSLGLAILVSNLFRGPIVRTVAARRGADHARKVAREEQKYVVVSFDARKHGSYLHHFLKRDRYRQMFQRAFSTAYKRTFQESYTDLIDTSAIRQRGYRDGLKHGEARERNARIQKRTAPVPLKSDWLERLKTRHLPSYLDGYTDGYEEAWKDFPQGGD